MLRLLFVLGALLCSSAPALAQSLPDSLDIQVPTVTRPMTDNIKGFDVTQMFWMTAAKMVLAAQPNEGALCISGIFDPATGKLGGLSAELAEVAEASSINVVYRCPVDRWTVGIGHSHLLDPGEYCHHSAGFDTDALEHSMYLFSIVFCSDGMAEVQMQDGRHSIFAWHPSAPFPSVPPDSTNDSPGGTPGTARTLSS